MGQRACWGARAGRSNTMPWELPAWDVGASVVAFAKSHLATICFVAHLFTLTWHPVTWTPADLVTRVESVWEQMEQQAEQQLAGQEQLQLPQ